MNTYKNTTDNDLVIANVGVVAAGKTIDTEETLVSANLKDVTPTKTAPESAPSTPEKES